MKPVFPFLFRTGLAVFFFFTTAVRGAEWPPKRDLGAHLASQVPCDQAWARLQGFARTHKTELMLWPMAVGAVALGIWGMLASGRVFALREMGQATSDFDLGVQSVYGGEMPYDRIAAAANLAFAEFRLLKADTRTGVGGGGGIPIPSYRERYEANVRAFKQETQSMLAAGLPLEEPEHYRLLRAAIIYQDMQHRGPRDGAKRIGLFVANQYDSYGVALAEKALPTPTSPFDEKYATEDRKLTPQTLQQLETSINKALASQRQETKFHWR